MISSDFSNVMGVVRLSQIDSSNCVIDGTIDGLSPGLHGLHIHETGDLSDGCNNLGDHYNPRGVRHGSPDHTEHHPGDLGNIQADENGRACFRNVTKDFNITEVIGRSMAVKKDPDNFTSENYDSSLTLACGIIARSSGVFQNPKRICPCSGKTIWDERNKPSFQQSSL